MKRIGLRFLATLTLLLAGILHLSAQERDSVQPRSAIFQELDTMRYSPLTPRDTVITPADIATTPPPRYSNFSPDPTKAVWYSALMPGLGQLYNRKYWKLPIVIGAYAGLTYGTTWNARYYADYATAYQDIMDDDPNTRSYMNFLPNNYDEASLDKDWMTGVLKSGKDYYRRNRDLCIISMVGVYLICMVDAYVDAQLFHFDISPDLSLQYAPTVIDRSGGSKLPLGMNLSLTF